MYYYLFRISWCWYSSINRKKIHLGYFIDEQDAQKVAQEAKQKYFGEFAYKINNF